MDMWSLLTKYTIAKNLEEEIRNKRLICQLQAQIFLFQSVQI